MTARKRRRSHTGAAVYGGLVAGDDLTVSATGLFSDKNAGAGKTVALASSYSGSDVNNYTIVDQSTTVSDISLKDLRITARNDNRIYDGIAYSGGNGVICTGFVSGEDISVLAGVLSYTGDSQAATGPGTYDIIPMGLSSGNYNIDFTAGTLTIVAAGIGESVSIGEFVFSTQLEPEANLRLPGIDGGMSGVESFAITDDLNSVEIIGAILSILEGTGFVDEDNGP